MKYLNLFENNYSEAFKVLENIEKYNKDMERLKPIIILIYEEFYNSGEYSLFKLPDNKNWLHIFQIFNDCNYFL